MDNIEKKLEELSDRISPNGMSEIEKNNILSELDLILQSDPLNTDALFWKGMVYEISEDYENAIAIYEGILKINPDDETAKDNINNCREFLQWKLDRSKIDLKHLENNNKTLDLLEKISIWHILLFKAIVIAIIIYVCLTPLISANQDKKILEKTNQVAQTHSPYRIKDREKPSNLEDFENLRINPMSDYDYLSKKEIYNIRKKYVNKSLFANPNYEPSEEVFGQIVDNKPWWGDIRCSKLNYKGDYHERIEGDSKVSIQINNPNVLVGLSMPYIPWDVPEYGDFCQAEYSKYIPYSLKYSKKDRIIIATYKLPREFLDFRSNVDGKNHRFIIQLSGLNARDFGYNYVWAFESNNIKFRQLDESTVKDEIQTFQDFIHLGGSCKYEDGCNNISPMQTPLMIKVTDFPAEINLKLWKKYPSNKYSKADIYYKIKFEENP